ncbi:patatin-like phospholipase family protein [Chromobacterium violaceum]|uniref:Patatin-like phospholipase n=1 Tax=Chromobacterium violaceum TaxID=536 RepID=A0AAX2MBN3_CHRVL|nr:patatin-like phospholipase family protein [Chromobacterium violaceum]OLZ75536.1 alpha/beta hydrolase [Chromobacterium violaceum]STB65119.1 Patatin-like phospholipase [Chromobacterium violaceum]SUX34050.1 Patatin-like phospholipase [Chromobacterium violaceum]
MAQSRNPSIALVLGGGAPNATLMAGALVALTEAGVKFDIISASGAGAIVGLLYAAPRQGDALAALSRLADMGVSDSIYSLFPVNFKVFNKPGALADAWRALLSRNPFLQAIQQQADDSPAHRLFADWTSLALAALCPSGLTSDSQGLCAHVPFIEQVVDFSKLQSLPGEFYLNAYNISRGEMRCWDKREITHEHFLAALSFPFIYPPYKLEDGYYIEGAAIDTLNFKRLFELHPHIDYTIVFDVLGSDKLLHPPRNLYDAWVQSIIAPLTEIARDDLRLFQAQHNRDENGQPRTEVLKIDFDAHIRREGFREELDWSFSNLSRLYDAGYRAGQDTARRYARELGLKAPLQMTA